MRFSTHIFIVFLALTSWSATPEAVREETDHNVDQIDELGVTPSDSLDSTKRNRDPFWSRLLEQLGKPKIRYSTFVEERHFPFRRTPVILNGEIRIVPNRGLSLRYLEPQEQILIVDEAGILMRDHKGRQRTGPSDSRASSVSMVLTQIISFEMQELVTNFDIHGRHHGDNW